MRRRLAAVALSLALIAAGCTSSEPADHAAEPAPSTSSPASAIGTDEAFTVDDHLAWLIGVLEIGAFDPDEATERFDAAFLAEVPVAALNAPLTQVAPPQSAPWLVIEDQRDGTVAEVIVESITGTRLLLTFAITLGLLAAGLLAVGAVAFYSGPVFYLIDDDRTTPPSNIEIFAQINSLGLALVFLAMTLAVGAVIAIASASLRQSMPGWFTIFGYVVAATQPAALPVLPVLLIPIWALTAGFVFLRRPLDPEPLPTG